MPDFATLPAAERALVLQEAAGRMGLAAVIVEKDFWVCWALGLIFAQPAVAPHVVFKRGTSLAKVYGVIQRFSEDIDLAVAPTALGTTETALNEAPSASARRKRMEALAAACEQCVAQVFQPALEAAFRRALGAPRDTPHWLRYQIDAVAGTPNLLFNYPSALAQPGGYIAKQVKLEFGALTNQQPTARHRVTALLASTPGAALGQAYADLASEVQALHWNAASGRRPPSCTRSTTALPSFHCATAMPATTPTSPRSGSTPAAPQRWRAWTCWTTWCSTRAASSLWRGPTTPVRSPAPSSWCRLPSDMLRWRTTTARCCPCSWQNHRPSKSCWRSWPRLSAR
jgi:hypothetical protein